MAAIGHRADKKWPSKRRWYVRKFYTMADIRRMWVGDPAKRLAMKRARLWVRSKFGGVI